MKDSMRRTVKRTKMKVRRGAPLALTIMGILTGIAASVLACKKARTMDAELEEENQAIADAKEAVDAADSDDEKKEAKQALTKARAKKGVKLGKMFGLPVLLGGLAIGMVTGSYVLMAADLAGTTAALKKVTKTFNEYRANTIDVYGEQADKELRFGKHKESVTVKSADPDTGEIHEQTVKAMKAENGTHDYDFAIPFCRTYCGTAFQDNYYYDNLTISGAFDDCTLKLRRDGYIFASDIYEKFNFDQTPDSRVMGRMIGKDEDPNTARIDYTVEETWFSFGVDEDGEPITEKGYIIDIKGLEPIADRLPKPRKKGVPTRR